MLRKHVMLIRNQQVRGSSPRVGSSFYKRLRTDDTSSQTNVSPQCHQIAGAQPRPLLPCASPVTPAYAAPMWKRTQRPHRPRPSLSWIEHRPSQPRVAGSNPAGRAIFLKNSPLVPTAWAPGAKVQAKKVTGQA